MIIGLSLILGLVRHLFLNLCLKKKTNIGTHFSEKFSYSIVGIVFITSTTPQQRMLRRGWRWVNRGTGQ